jgi:CO dehydrogenase nickel-insertion accessory protein CooC1
MAKASQTTAENGESTIHLTLQGKGGVGKSLIAAILAQFFQNSGRDVRCIDTDPVNRTFAQYVRIPAKANSYSEGSRTAFRAEGEHYRRAATLAF